MARRHFVSAALMVSGACSLVAVTAHAQAAADTTPTRVTVLPVFGSAPETGVQYGATVARLFRQGPAATTRSSTDQIFVTYTAKQQLKAFVQRELWTRDNVWRLRGRVEFTDYPLPYFGIGGDAPEAAEEWYTARAFLVQAFAQRQIRPSVFLSAGYRYTHTSVEDLEADGALINRGVDGADGGTISQLIGSVIYDSRDNPFAARAGRYLDLQVAGASEATGSDFTFGRYTLDARGYRGIGSGHVVAAQVLLETTSGRPSFDQLALVGADTHLRGYARGRYRDRHLASAQAEFRTAYWRRIGGVVFAGGGVIADQVGDLPEGRFIPTVGAGVRYMLFPAERSAIRVDFGVGRGSGGLYVAFAEAF